MKLDHTTQARIVVAFERLELGNTSSLKPVGAGVSEIRLDFGPGFRIYLAQDGDTLVILLGGGTKKRQSLDIEAAKNRWREYKLAKRNQ